MHPALQNFNRLTLRAILLCSILCLISANLDLIQTLAWNSQRAALRSAFPGLALVGVFVKLVLMQYRKWRTIFEIAWVMMEFALFGYSLEALRFFDQSLQFVNLEPVYYVSFMVLCILSIVSLLSVIWSITFIRGAGIFSIYSCKESESDPVWTVLLGHDVFKKRFSSDNYIIRFVRGVLALALLLLIILLAFYYLIITPSSLNFNGVEVQTYSGITDVSLTLTSVNFNWVYILLDKGMLPVTNVSDFAMEESLTVRLVKWESLGSTETIALNCVFDFTQAITMASCPVGSGFFNVQAALAEGRIDPTLFAGIDVSFDFSSILNSSGLTSSGWPSALPLQAYVGFTNSLQSIWANTPPVFLNPGSQSNVFGELSFKQQLVNRGLAVVGISWKSDNFAFLKTITQIPGSGAPTNSTIGSFTMSFGLRLLGQVERENKGSSVLQGFASLGGIWTTLTGAFGTIFGSSLLLILFQKKPVSIYGLIHAVYGGGKLYLEEGDRLSTRQRGEFVDLLHKHLIDTGEHHLEANELNHGHVGIRDEESGPVTGQLAQLPQHYPGSPATTTSYKGE
ncbi:hypothetical protein NP233_g4651 [Leucocoprinus birnbaumii]|uniref:Uncharacterized protein n=1 Tax=Leucocoprinus birnbaumii TaxID=56174 RepID=A0AAD5VUW3_9AGAR|nr:hypothetical protein NP233_g4651 [Leucocoprinus birnbaumii]